MRMRMEYGIWNGKIPNKFVTDDESPLNLGTKKIK